MRSSIWVFNITQGAGTGSTLRAAFEERLVRQPIDWNAYALVATIEEARRDRGNSEIPPYMREAYESAWRDLVNIGLRELQDAESPMLVCSIIGVIAVGKGQFTLGRLAVSFTENERQELLVKVGWC